MSKLNKEVDKLLEKIEKKIDDRKLFTQVNSKITLLRCFIVFVFLVVFGSVIYLVK